jgi:hypothetical protein
MRPEVSPGADRFPAQPDSQYSEIFGIHGVGQFRYLPGQTVIDRIQIQTTSKPDTYVLLSTIRRLQLPNPSCKFK